MPLFEFLAIFCAIHLLRFLNLAVPCFACLQMFEVSNFYFITYLKVSDIYISAFLFLETFPFPEWVPIASVKLKWYTTAEILGASFDL